MRVACNTFQWLSPSAFMVCPLPEPIYFLKSMTAVEAGRGDSDDSDGLHGGQPVCDSEVAVSLEGEGMSSPFPGP